MRLTFLGTGTSQGIPVIGCLCAVCKSSNLKDKRLRCAAYIQTQGGCFLIDSGPDIRFQSLRSDISTIDGVLLTHEHYDHTGGLDDLRPFGFMSGGVTLCAKKEVLDIIKQKYDYAFGIQKYPGAPRYLLQELHDFESFQLGHSEIIPIPITHGQLSILGFIIDQKLAYITDANAIPAETMPLLRNIDTLVINALHHKEHHSHFTLAQTLNIVTVIQPQKTYIIHMSHLMGFHDQVQARLPKNVFLAYDTLTLEIE